MKLGESKKMEVEGDLGVSAANHGVWFWVPHAGASGLPDTNIFKLLQLLKIFSSCGERNSSRVTLASTNLCNGRFVP
jgi:hypothetical protein